MATVWLLSRLVPAHEMRVSREATDVEDASLRGNSGRSVLTFKNDTEGALADLLADSEMVADNAVVGRRRRRRV